MRLLGHPLHTALIHFPIAFWSLATVLDCMAVMGLYKNNSAAVALIELGLVLGLLSMITGFSDLIKLPESARRTGNNHMALMCTAWVLYFITLFSRDTGILSVVTSILGFTCLIIGGYYGGKLVYRYKAGQDF